MKKLLAFAVVACVAASAFVSCGGSASLKTDEDSISYALGVNLGMQIKEDPNIRIDALLAGISDTYHGKEKIQQADAGRIINDFFNVKLPAKNLKASQDFLAEVEKNNPNVQKTQSGLLYEVLVAGDQAAKPTSDSDVVKVLYEGLMKDGKVFESSKESGDTVEFALNGVIPGWTEGLKYVGKGGKIKLWLPAELAYGQMGNQMYGGPIGPNEALVFEIDLVDVTPAPAAEEE